MDHVGIGLLILLVAACGTDRGQPTSVVHRDSSGIVIVESFAPQWSSEDAWEVEDFPELDLGLLDGEAPYVFAQPSSARILSDGSIVVVDRGSSEVRRYDAEGNHIWSVGRKGTGPGEFSFPTGAIPMGGDTLAVIDPALRRTTRLAPDGTMTVLQGIAPTGRLSSGTWIGQSFMPLEDRRPGPAVTRSVILRWSGLDSPVDTVAVLSGGKVVATPMEGTDGLLIAPMPFGGDRYIAVGQDLWTSDGSSFEVVKLNEGGQAQLIARRSGQRRPITQNLKNQLEERELSGAPEQLRPEIERRLSSYVYPDSVPAWDALLADRTGHLWARHYTTESSEGQIWSVFGRNGIWLGEVTTPEGLRVYDIANGVLVGLWRDELQVPHIRVYRIANYPVTSGN